MRETWRYAAAIYPWPKVRERVEDERTAKYEERERERERSAEREPGAIATQYGGPMTCSRERARASERERERGPWLQPRGPSIYPPSSFSLSLSSSSSSARHACVLVGARSSNFARVYMYRYNLAIATAGNSCADLRGKKGADFCISERSFGGNAVRYAFFALGLGDVDTVVNLLFWYGAKRLVSNEQGWWIVYIDDYKNLIRWPWP